MGQRKREPRTNLSPEAPPGGGEVGASGLMSWIARAGGQKVTIRTAQRRSAGRVPADPKKICGTRFFSATPSSGCGLRPRRSPPTCPSRLKARPTATWRAFIATRSPMSRARPTPASPARTWSARAGAPRDARPTATTEDRTKALRARPHRRHRRWEMDDRLPKGSIQPRSAAFRRWRGRPPSGRGRGRR